MQVSSNSVPSTGHKTTVISKMSSDPPLSSCQSSTHKPWCLAYPVRNLIVFCVACVVSHSVLKTLAVFAVIVNPAAMSGFGGLPWFGVKLCCPRGARNGGLTSQIPTLPLRSERTEGNISYESYHQSLFLGETTSVWGSADSGVHKDLNHPLT